MGLYHSLMETQSVFYFKSNIPLTGQHFWWCLLFKVLMGILFKVLRKPIGWSVSYESIPIQLPFRWVPLELPVHAKSADERFLFQGLLTTKSMWLAKSTTKTPLAPATSLTFWRKATLRNSCSPWTGVLTPELGPVVLSGEPDVSWRPGLWKR